MRVATLLDAFTGAVRRRRWVVLGVWAAVIGFAALVSLLEPATYRAETQLVVGPGNGPLQPDSIPGGRAIAASFKELVRSDQLAGNVIQNIGLPESRSALLDRISVTTPRPAVLQISVDDHRRDRARQLAQEVGLVYSQLVQSRFGRGRPTRGHMDAVPPLAATIWDPAHVLPGRVGPNTARTVSIATILGLLLGLAAAVALDRIRAPAPEGTAAGEVSRAARSAERERRRLEARAEELARRDRQLAARESRLAERERAVSELRRSAPRAAPAPAEAERAAINARAEPEARPQAADGAREAVSPPPREAPERAPAPPPREEPKPEPRVREPEPDLRVAPEPEPEPELELEPDPAALQPALGAPTLVVLDRLIDQHAADHPDRVEEWRYYTLYLREFADVNGRLPAEFDALVDDVFGVLLSGPASR